jgi:hypothetical protein
MMNLEKQVKNSNDIKDKPTKFDVAILATPLIVLSGMAGGIYVGEHFNEDIGFLRELKETVPAIRYFVDAGTGVLGAACTSAVALIYYTIKNMNW